MKALYYGDNIGLMIRSFLRFLGCRFPLYGKSTEKPSLNRGDHGRT